MTALYVKVAALNFGATVFDSDDLSTIRGSSLALLRFPTLLLKRLAVLYDGRLIVDPVLTSASETVLRIKALGTGDKKGEWYRGDPPKGAGIGKPAWRKAINATVETLGPADDESRLRAAAEMVCGQFDKLRNLAKIDYVIRQIELARAAMPAPSAAPVDLAGAVPDVEQACLELIRVGDEGWVFEYFTFAVASHLDQKNWKLDRIFAVLDNRLRRRQQETLTVPLPERGPIPVPSASKAVCRVTGVLAAVTDSSEPRSKSVNSRGKSGREQRQDFYQEQLKVAGERAAELLGELPAGVFRKAASNALQEAATALPGRKDVLEFQQLCFAESFEDIVAKPPDGLPPGARNKLAVIYLDGNGFGEAALKRATDRDAYRRYSRYLEVQGGLLLDRLLDWMLKRPTMRASGASDDRKVYRLRFETLLWGGDEMLFVLPAWEAADFMTMLQAALADWPVPEEKEPEGRLSFATGMVFSHCKTPIRDLRQVAKKLCDTVKKTKRRGNWLQTLSLEGIDRADIDPAAVRWMQLGAGEERHADFDIEGARWEELVSAARTLSARLGQTQLHRCYRNAEKEELIKIEGGLDEKARAELQATIRRLGELGADRETAARLDGDLFAAGGGAWAFLPLHQLLELWDFLTPGELEAKEQAA